MVHEFERPGLSAVERTVTADAGSPRPRPPLPLLNLLNDFDRLGELAAERIAAGDVLNAYLLVAGMEQVAADHLARDRFSLQRAAVRARRLFGVRGRLLAAALDSASLAVRSSAAARPGSRSARRWHARLLPVLDSLADELVATGCWDSTAVSPRLVAAVRDAVARSRLLPPGLRETALALPTCFRNLDQSSADIEELSRRIDSDGRLRRREVVVVGVRSSGSYLAPLTAAFLRSLGRAGTRSRSIRPGAPWPAELVSELRAAAAEGTVAVVVDDPPTTWNAVGTTARTLAKLGFPPSRVAVAVAVIPGFERPPETLRGHPVVTLGWREWEVSSRIGAGALPEGLGVALSGEVERVAIVEAPAPRRGHVRALLEVTTAGPEGRRSHLVRARGVGSGYFGEHSLGVAAALGGWAPEILCLDRGVIYERAAPAALEEPLGARDLSEVARYVHDRARATRGACTHVGKPPARFLAPAWAATPLAPLFGRFAEAGRPVVRRALCAELAVDRPSLLDGRMEVARFARREDGTLLKTDYDFGVFTGMDLVSFDPVFDLAGAAVSLEDGAGADRLRAEYERLSGGPIEAARWLLLQIVHACERDGGWFAEAGISADRVPRAFQRYYGELLRAVDRPDPHGPLCAIDVDGVLETMRLGIPCTTPAGAGALHALSAHGFRPVLATGRSLAEVRERCESYRLAGGVAEYGAALVAGGVQRTLLDAAEEQALDALRRALGRREGVVLDPRHRCSVRAYRVEEGRRRAIPAEVASDAVAEAGAGGVVKIVPGRLQTDFAAARLDKADGLWALSSLLGAPAVMAVGDTLADAGMLRSVALAFAPRDADPALRAAGARVLGTAGPRAVADAAAAVLGHRPGSCPLCALRWPAGSRLLELLGLPDRPPTSRALAALRLAFAPPRG